jgi:hypothetical protein
MSTGFDTRLREQLLDGLPAHRRRRRRRDRAVLGVVAAVLVVGAGVGLAASSGGEDSSTELTDTGPPSTTVDSTTTEAPTTTHDGPIVLPDVSLPEGPELTSSASPTEAVTEMVAALRAGDTPGAATHWTGYPDVLVLPDVDVAAEKVDALDALVAAAPWLLDADLTTTEVDGPAFPGNPPPKIVTITATTDEGPRAMAFVAGRVETDGRWVVGRVPTAPYGVPVTPEAGATVASGSTVTFLTSPIEGGARAYVDGVEVPVEDDRAATELRVAIPAGAVGAVTVTIAIATPELTDALAAVYVIG